MLDYVKSRVVSRKAALIISCPLVVFIVCQHAVLWGMVFANVGNYNQIINGRK